MKNEINFPVNPNESIADHNKRVNEIINPIIVNALADEIGATATPKKSTQKKSVDKPAFSSLTAGDKTYAFTDSIKKSFRAQYPGLLELIEKSGFTSGREYTLYFRHTIKNDGKKRDIITFIKSTGTRKNVDLKRPVDTKFSPDTFKKSYPALAAYLGKFDDVIFIVGYFGKREYRALHLSYKF